MAHQPDLLDIVVALEKGDRLGHRGFAAANRQILLHEPSHLGRQILQLAGGQWLPSAHLAEVTAGSERVLDEEIGLGKQTDERRLKEERQ